MAAQELRWLTYLLTDLGEPPRSPPVLYVDNKAMLALCREQRVEHRTKHIALRYFLARELQQRGQLRLAYVASEANTADVFTKALAPCDHQHCCTQLGLLCFALLDWSCTLGEGSAGSGGILPRIGEYAGGGGGDILSDLAEGVDGMGSGSGTGRARSNDTKAGQQERGGGGGSISAHAGENDLSGHGPNNSSWGDHDWRIESATRDCGMGAVHVLIGRRLAENLQLHKLERLVAEGYLLMTADKGEAKWMPKTRQSMALMLNPGTLEQYTLRVYCGVSESEDFVVLIGVEYLFGIGATICMWEEKVQYRVRYWEDDGPIGMLPVQFVRREPREAYQC
ncbi:unnamed protein product [Closterium sp. NIES-53]